MNRQQQNRYSRPCESPLTCRMPNGQLRNRAASLPRTSIPRKSYCNFRKSQLQKSYLTVRSRKSWPAKKPTSAKIQEHEKSRGLGYCGFKKVLGQARRSSRGETKRSRSTPPHHDSLPNVVAQRLRISEKHIIGYLRISSRRVQNSQSSQRTWTISIIFI